jgi:hypothetical protein
LYFYTAPIHGDRHFFGGFIAVVHQTHLCAPKVTKKSLTWDFELSIKPSHEINHTVASKSETQAFHRCTVRYIAALSWCTIFAEREKKSKRAAPRNRHSRFHGRFCDRCGGARGRTIAGATKVTCVLHDGIMWYHSSCCLWEGV